MAIFSFLLIILFSQSALARDCALTPPPAYFECGEKDCSLLFAVKNQKSIGNCTSIETGFHQDQEAFLKMAVLFWNTKRFLPNKTYEVDFPSSACFRFNKPHHAKIRELLSLKDHNSNIPNRLESARLSTAFRCARYANVKEISPEDAMEAQSHWAKTITRNHIAITGAFLLFLFGMELFFWWVRASYSTQLPKFALIFIVIPIIGLAYSYELTAQYLFWPIYAFRFALEAYGKQFSWRKYAQALAIAILAAMALIQIAQAFLAIRAL